MDAQSSRRAELAGPPVDRLLHRVGDRGKTESAYGEALRIDPSRQDLAEWLSRLRQGVDLLSAELPVPAARAEHDGEGAHPPNAPGDWLSGLPPDPAALPLFDPMRGPQRPLAGPARP